MARSDDAVLSKPVRWVSSTRGGFATQQGPFAQDELRRIADGLRARHPRHTRVLVACAQRSLKSGREAQNLIADQKLVAEAAALGFDHVRCSPDTDDDLDYLSRCGVLVAARSTFSLVALVFSRDAEARYAPRDFFGSAVARLFTRVDYSGVRDVGEMLRG